MCIIRLSDNPTAMNCHRHNNTYYLFHDNQAFETHASQLFLAAKGKKGL